MPAYGRPNPHTQPARRGRRGYVLLASAWLLLGAGALAGWLAVSSRPAHRPVHTATLHRADLPRADLPEPARANAPAEAIGPRVHQFAARPSPSAGAHQIEPAAEADPAPGTEPDSKPEEARETAGDTRPRPGTSPSAQPAAGGDGTDADAAANPAPEPTTDATTDPAAIPQVKLAARTDKSDANPPPAGPPPPPVPRSVVGPAARPAAEAAGGRYSIQVGAFRQRENAVERAARLGQAGYDVRIVHAFATRSRLYMVRLGQFDARPAAMAYAHRLAQDVGMETWPVRN